MASANSFLKRIEELALLDDRILAQLRKQVAEAKGSVSAETLAKVLVDNGHLTVFQAKKIIGDLAPEDESPATKSPSKQPSRSAPPKTSAKAPAKAKAPPPAKPAEEELGLAADEDDLGLADDEGGLTPIEDDSDGLMPLDEDSGGLEPLDDDGLTPIDDGGGLTPIAETAPVVPTPPAAAASSLDDLLGGSGTDPLADPLLSAASAEAASPLLGQTKPSGSLFGGLFGGGGKSKNKNQWDSALIYVGGGALVFLCFAFVMLYLLLARGSATKEFQLAEEDFQRQAYAQAIVKYERYLARYEGDDKDDTSLAKVRIGVCQIRQSVDAGDMVEALSVTEEILKGIESEEKFDEARNELADILPNIAKSLAEDARRNITNIPQATHLLEHAQQAIELVNDGAYIPPHLRPPVEAKVAAIQEDISFVKREIERDRELKIAVEKMQAETEAGKTAEAFAIRRALLKRYPGLDVTEPVVKATLAITAKEQTLVQVQAQAIEATAEVAASSVREIVLADGSNAAGDSGSLVVMLVRGSVYGLEPTSGRMVWRRFLGFQNTTQPLAVADDPNADVIASDVAQRTVMRLNRADGKVKWQLKIGEAFAPPTVVGERLLVTTETGSILDVDLATGASNRRAVLPQGAAQGVASDARRPFVYQLGTHSTLFALSADSLKCEEAYFLGHAEGSIAASPVATGGQIFVAVNEGADYAVVHVVSTDSDGKNLAKTFDPVRVKGHVVTSPVVDGRRVYVFTNLGAVHVFDIDPANTTQPVQELTRLIATRKQPLTPQASVNEGRVWLGDERLTMYELQPARKELTRRWSQSEGEIFLAPPRVNGNTLIVPRARQIAGDVYLGGMQVADGNQSWGTSLSVPVLALAPADSGWLALNANGSAFAIPASISSDSVLASATARLDTVGEPPQFAGTVQLPGDLIGLLPKTGKAQWGVAKAGANRVLLISWPESQRVASQGVAFNGGLLLPLQNGQLVLANPATGKSLTFPFQPRLDARSNVAWSAPLNLQGAAVMFAVADQEAKQLYLVGQKQQPEPHLALAAQASLAGELVGTLAQAEENILAVVRGDAGQSLSAFALPDLAPGGTLPLAGSVMFGPVTVDDAIFVVSDQGGLVCVNNDLSQRWALPLSGENLVAPPSKRDSDYLIVTTNGDVLSVETANGAVKKKLSTGRPLNGAPVTSGQQLFFPGLDGAVYVVPLTDLEG